jgi:hypothetical protein
MLRQLHGWGVVELRWKDDDGNHFRQGDLEFWIDGPDRLSVRVSKLGDPYFWLGTDGKQAWVFDLSGSPTRLLTGRVDELEALKPQDGEMIGILETLHMLRLGLGCIPPDTGVRGLSTRSDGQVLFTTASARGGTIEETINPDTWRPTQVRWRAAQGERGLTLVTQSRRTLRVRIPERASIASPIVSSVLEVRHVPDSGQSARFAFEGLSTDMSGQPLDRVFDVGQLKAALGPEVEEPLIIERTQGGQR